MKDPITSPELAQFKGTERWYRHALNRDVLFTDGVKFVADRGSAYWLLDEIALLQTHDKRIASKEFQVWKLKVNANQSAELFCEDGNDNVILTKSIQFTDFPGDGITLWFRNFTILLPSEY